MINITAILRHPSTFKWSLLNTPFNRLILNRIKLFHDLYSVETIRDQFLKLPVRGILWFRWFANKNNTHPRIQVKVVTPQCASELWSCNSELVQGPEKTRGSFLGKMLGLSISAPIAHMNAATYWTPTYVKLWNRQTQRGDNTGFYKLRSVKSLFWKWSRREGTKQRTQKSDFKTHNWQGNAHTWHSPSLMSGPVWDNKCF